MFKPKLTFQNKIHAELSGTFQSRRISCRIQSCRIVKSCRNDLLSNIQFVEHTFFEHTFCQTFILLNIHFVKHTFCRTCIFSNKHFVEKTFCWTYILSNIHFDKYTYCRTYILSNIHFVESMYRMVDPSLAWPHPVGLFFFQWETSPWGHIYWE
jgi:hypothetical protein